MSTIKEYYHDEIAAGYATRNYKAADAIAETEEFMQQLFRSMDSKIPAGYVRYLDGRLEKVEEVL